MTEFEEMGRAAHQRGLPCAPALDKYFTQRLSPKVGENIKRSIAWNRGWTAENLKEKAA